jgi:phosphoribosylaminoimidazole-succinocarboxamide synthase
MSGLMYATLDGRGPDFRGKVRDVFDLGDQLLLVATDRVSAYDVVLPAPVPDRGKILTALSNFWLDRFEAAGVAHHRVTADEDRFPAAFQASRADLGGRSMLAVKAATVPIECVARGYLAGSGWKEYQQTRTVCGVPLPEGLVESQQLPEPIFTPATKAVEGHDENISFERCGEIVGLEMAARLRDITLRIYADGAAYARQRGVIIADTKFEFGLHEGKLILIDEVLTPDSSRFWDVDEYAPGGPQRAMDKQFLRDWLETQPWDKTPPGPTPPPEVINTTRERYLEALTRLTGRTSV